MNDLQTLIEQKAAIEAQIAAHKPAAVAEVVATMQRLGVTWEDLGVMKRSGVSAVRSTRPVKYRDASGNTWTGVGQRPRWLTAAVLAGATVEQFRV